MSKNKRLASFCCIIGLTAFSSVTRAGSLLLWIDDSAGNIGTVGVPSGTATVIGNSGVGLTDIAFDSSGNLWGVDFYNLYRINTTTGAASLVGATGLDGTNALVFGPTGTLYTAATDSTNLYSLNTTTGAATLLGNDGFESDGDLAFNGGNLYLSGGNGNLVEINLATDVGTVVGSTGFSNVYGLATGDDGVLYGVANSSIFSINTATGEGTLVTTYGTLGPANGTAFVNEVTSGSAVPLPAAASTGFATLAILGCGTLLRKNRLSRAQL